MAHTDQQIQSLLRSDVHFPPRFPELAALEILAVRLPRRDQAEQQQKARKSASRTNSVYCLEITEVQPTMVQRLVPLRDVRSIFLPNDEDTRKVDLEKGEWIFWPQLQDEEQAARILQDAKDLVGKRSNPRGLGIAFIVESARILNTLTICASAQESCLIYDRFAVRDCDPCC